MLKSHAKTLLKAIEFWELNYDKKYEEWRSNFVAADRASLARRLARTSSGEADSDEIFEDEGYESNDSDSGDSV
jgi:hypothetical protein